MLTRKQVAEWLGYTVHTLVKWAKMVDFNGLPFVKAPGSKGGVRYRREDVEAWIKRNTVGGG